LLGSVAENGRKLKSGVVLPEVLNFVNYWALGDIHKRQKVKGFNAWYPGSPIQHKFGDPDDCGVLIVDTDSFIPNVVMLDMPRLVTAESIEESEAEATKGNIVRLNTDVALDAEEKQRMHRNVVKVNLSIPKGDNVDIGSPILLGRVRRDLRAAGASKKQIKLAVKECESIVKDLGLHGAL